MIPVILLWSLCGAAPAFAHAGHAYGMTDPAWSWEPWVSASLAISAALYARGWQALRARGIVQRTLGVLRPLCFAAGMVTLTFALVSPLDALAARSFTAHMVQHLLLMLVAPPLLVWSRPVYTWLWAFPLTARRQIGRCWMQTGALHGTYAFLTRPAVTWLLASAALWLWHLPGPYDFALANEGVHVVEHLSFFLTSLAFWTLVERPQAQPGTDTGAGTALVMVATFALHNGMLGALLTFSTVPFYASYLHGASTAAVVEDQQAAGLIMWVPAGMVHLVALALLFPRWLNSASAGRSTQALAGSEGRA